MKPTLEQTPDMLANLTTMVENLTKSLSDTKEREEILCRQQVANMFLDKNGKPVSPDTITRWVNNGSLPAYGQGKGMYFFRSEVFQFLKGCKYKAA